jgi:FkbM family methyltransferase
MNFYQKRLSHLRNLGFLPKVIYDIGAWQGKWSQQAEKIFPNSHYYLFEANAKNIPFLEKTGHSFFIELLGHKDMPAIFYTTIKEGLGTGDSVFKENTTVYSEKNCKEVILQMKTLSSLVKKHQLLMPDLIKIDVQGSEKSIIQGGIEIILSAKAVILEARLIEYNQGAPLFAELVNLMDNLGFQMVDILEISYLNGLDIVDMDVLFLKKNSEWIRSGILF